MCTHEAMLLHTSSISVQISCVLDTQGWTSTYCNTPQQLNIFIPFCLRQKLLFSPNPRSESCMFCLLQQDPAAFNFTYFPTNIVLKSLYNNKWTIQYVLDNGSGSLWQQGYHIHLISFMGIHNIPLNCHQRTGCKGMRSSRGAYYKGSFYDTH